MPKDKNGVLQGTLDMLVLLGQGGLYPGPNRPERYGLIWSAWWVTETASYQRVTERRSGVYSTMNRPTTVRGFTG